MSNPYYLPRPKAAERRQWPADSAAHKYWALVDKHGGSRKSMVAFILGIGGYGSRHEQYAVSFSIKDHYSDLSVENLWNLLNSDRMDVGPDPKWSPEKLALAKSLFWRVHAEHKDKLWDWGVEEAYQGWADSDVPFECFTGPRIEWQWDVRGRCGGHLCLTECERIGLKCSTEYLSDSLKETDADGRFVIDAVDVVALFRLCVQLTVDLDSRAISAEINYRAAWRLWVSFCEDEIDSLYNKYLERETLGSEAETIYGMLTSRADMQSDDYNDTDRQRLAAAFKSICELADVKCEE